MQYLTGYSIKPYITAPDGEVVFTDGTNTDIRANQVQCEAYGYTYDSVAGICRAFQYNTRINRDIDNLNNKINGPGNITELGSNNIQINGANNTTKGFNNNCLVNGSNNEIANGITDATVVGVGGKAKVSGEFVIGGGTFDPVGAEGISTLFSDRKVSIVNLTGTTSNNNVTKLVVNGGLGYINVNLNSVVGFEIYITRFENGEGSSGTAGNYSYRNIKGVVRIDNAGAMLFQVGFTRNIGKIGVNGTTIMADTGLSTTSPSITVTVQDRNNVTNIWSATVYLHELTSYIDIP